MSDQSGPVGEGYARALVSAFVHAVGGEEEWAGIATEALASFFTQQFSREASRLPADGREEYLSAVALEFLTRIQSGNFQSRPSSVVEVERLFRRAAVTVLDTVRHRIMRARIRFQAREQDLLDSDSLNEARRGPDFEGLLTAELTRTLSPSEMAVLYLVVEGHNIDEVAEKMSVSSRTIYRALREIKKVLTDYQMDEPF
jgi:hypothetical protein